MHDRTSEILTNLIRIGIDSNRGFLQAADTISNERMARLFRQIARDREHLAGELRDFVTLPEEDAGDPGTLAGSVHRWWLCARGTLNGGDDYVVLIEAERGEDAIRQCYEDAIDAIDDPSILQVLNRQFAEIKRGHEAIRALRALAA